MARLRAAKALARAVDVFKDKTALCAEAVIETRSANDLSAPSRDCIANRPVLDIISYGNRKFLPSTHWEGE